MLPAKGPFLTWKKRTFIWVGIEKAPADGWVGYYWKKKGVNGWRRHVYICLVPFRPIHLIVENRELLKAKYDES